MTVTDKSFAEMLGALKPYVLHAGECLIERIEDNSNGQRVTLRFAEDQHPLRDLIENDGFTRIIHAIFIETDDKGTPIDQQRAYQIRNAELKGGEYCQKFHILIREHQFHRFMYQAKGLIVLAEMSEAERKLEVETTIRTLILKGQSSRMLDHDPNLRDNFISEIYEPYKAWKRERDRA